LEDPSPSPGGVNASVFSISAPGSTDSVYTGGLFKTAGNALSPFMAEWDTKGEKWKSLGGGNNPGLRTTVTTVYTYPCQSDFIYFGGTMTVNKKTKEINSFFSSIGGFTQVGGIPRVDSIAVNGITLVSSQPALRIAEVSVIGARQVDGM